MIYTIECRGVYVCLHMRQCWGLISTCTCCTLHYHICHYNIMSFVIWTMNKLPNLIAHLKICNIVCKSEQYAVFTRTYDRWTVIHVKSYWVAETRQDYIHFNYSVQGIFVFRFKYPESRVCIFHDFFQILINTQHIWNSSKLCLCLNSRRKNFVWILYNWIEIEEGQPGTIDTVFSQWCRGYNGSWTIIVSTETVHLE